ncbi:Tn3 family transposase [Streptomyces sparsogenes]|uniref:Tn3 family transposase n=1 Tax=Streptomyces sparsogenes TaxID=67365 RepID=UPI0033E16B03
MYVQAPPLGHGDQAERVVGEGLGEQLVGPAGAGQGSVHGEVSDLLQVPELDRDAGGRHGGHQRAVCGQVPSSGGLQPLAGQEKRGHPGGRPASLQGYEVGGASAGRAAGVVDAVGTASTEAILRRFTRNASHPIYAALLEAGRAQKIIFVARYLRLRDLQQGIEEGLNVMESFSGASSLIDYGKGGEIASNRRNEQEMFVLCRASCNRPWCS